MRNLIVNKWWIVKVRPLKQGQNIKISSCTEDFAD